MANTELESVAMEWLNEKLTSAVAAEQRLTCTCEKSVGELRHKLWEVYQSEGNRQQMIC